MQDTRSTDNHADICREGKLGNSKEERRQEGETAVHREKLKIMVVVIVKKRKSERSTSKERNLGEMTCWGPSELYSFPMQANNENLLLMARVYCYSVT